MFQKPPLSFFHFIIWRFRAAENVISTPVSRESGVYVGHQVWNHIRHSGVVVVHKTIRGIRGSLFKYVEWIELKQASGDSQLTGDDLMVVKS